MILQKGHTVTALLLISSFIISCSSETPEQQIEKAGKYFQQKNYRTAVIELKRVISSDEKNIAARKLLGKIYLEVGDGLTSEKEFERYIQYGGNKNDIALDLARALLLSQQYEKLVYGYKAEQFEGAEQKAVITTYIGDAFIGLNNHQEAAQKYKQALVYKKDFPPAKLGFAGISVYERKWDIAASQLKKLTESHPEYRDAWILQAGLYRLQNKVDESIESYKKAIELDGPKIFNIKSYSIRVGLIQGLLVKKDIKGAEKYITAIAEAYPNYPYTMYYEGLLAYIKKDYELANNKLYEVTKLLPNLLPPYMLLGAIQYVNGNYEQSILSLTRYVDGVPGNLEARKLLAAVRVKLGQNEAALTILLPALSTGMSDNQVLALLGEIAARDSEGDQVTRTLKQAANKDPDNVALGNTLAVAYIRDARYEEALNSLEALGKAGNVRSVILQIQIYLHKSDISNARKLARSLYDLGLESYNADIVNGIVESVAGKSAEASRYFKNAIQASPDNIMARFYLARNELANGKFKESRKYFEEILIFQDTNVPAYMGLAQIEINSGNSDKALVWLKQAVASSKDDITPILILANYYIKKKDVDNAKRLLVSSQKQYPENAFRDMLMARVNQSSVDNETTIKYYKTLLDKYPNNSQMYIEFAVFLSRINQPEKAKRYLIQAIRIDPDSLRLQNALSLVQLQEGNVDQALEIARNMQTTGQDSTTGFNLAGDILMSQSRYKEAKSSYREALQRKPARKTLYKLYSAYYALGQKEDGLQLIESWLSEHPEDRDATFDYGNILLKEKRWDKAIVQYQSILEKSPGHLGSLNNIALAYMNVDLGQALKYAKQAYEQGKGNAALQDTLGWIYFKSGNTDKAFSLLKRAASQAEDPSIHYHLASVYADKGQVLKAKQMLETILGSDKFFEERKQAEELLKRLA
ncbi:MAG TPA: PEP-CTERM system TPR-repeat protein PrsT [Gammaproteobacteria bacterium]|nr:PEP-CTERM system TPR-repeat protein PrsT [Gammaproteobacteria bacterium]